jgi:hypothetical protein
MLKLLVLLGLLTPTTLAQTTNLQTCEGLFAFFKVPEIEGYPQAREIPVSVLVKALSILDPAHPFASKTLMWESNPEIYDPNANIVLLCSDNFLFFLENSDESKLIIYSLKQKTFVKTLIAGYPIGIWKMNERIYAVETIGYGNGSLIAFIDIVDGQPLTNTEEKALGDGSNWFFLGSVQARAFALYANQKLLVVENEWTAVDENGSTSEISEITLGLYEVTNSSLKVSKLGTCSFKRSNGTGNYKFMLTDEGIVINRIDKEKMGNAQLLSECQQLANSMKK